MSFPETKRLFRTVRNNPPTADDFVSGERMGRPRPAREERVRFWQGFSTFDTLETARRKARENPQQGTYIAEIAFPMKGV
jgi:hypothetical protein